MGTTTEAPPLTVREARRRLADTSRLSSEQVAELERVVAAFHAARPRDRACAACGSMIWREHETADGDATWACAGCHRASSLTFEAWHAQLAAKRGAEARAATEAAAAAPAPRAALGDALTRRAEAAAVVGGLEASLLAARTALITALAGHEAAVAGMRQAEQFAIERAAGQRTARADMPVDAARAKLRFFEDGLSAARGARALIDDKLHYARSSLANAEEAVRTAALAVLAREAFEDTLANAVVARANYLEAVGGLAWFLRNGAVPNGDARAAQLVAEASETPPGRWREAAAADGGMAQRLAELATPL